ncbi:precorrin-6A synthase (deacetylating) [Tsukamurella sp. 8F]|uniref:precorrin-6A synthase (deacetylating) n=1 Tax=unclassified Tsukamurella TaxID=2633480 RepID=UPI0023B8CE25|nr:MULTISPECIES: precorrin-6A synthase (deacetylating) [unclassified Tsukamurella]MDF0531915.1 precorrin-6A synthase (deacetylating) [Tsukamurella sp. 8J]MDF0586945.1 precorrin-6A synthase (deacetylating) [Tsukamurella sp. 8F]
MRRALLIGIGTGDPRQVTLQAVDAMQEVDAFFVLDKGATTGTLTGIRQEILDAYAPGAELIRIPDPPRDRSSKDYEAAVDDWHHRRAVALSVAITREVPDGGAAGFLVWGDPALYDSTLRVIRRAPIALEPTVIPGITSMQALTAAHAILLNRVGEPIHITTGRRLAEDDGRNTVVLLDADCTFLETAHPDDEIYWGAYLGTPQEILVSGTVGDVGEEIVRVRAAARAEHGWIMDVYLLRRP